MSLLKKEKKPDMFNCHWFIFHPKREISHIKSMLLSCLLIKPTVNSSSLPAIWGTQTQGGRADIMVCGPIAYNVVWGSCTPCDYEREGECEKFKPSIIVNSNCILMLRNESEHDVPSKCEALFREDFTVITVNIPCIDGSKGGGAKEVPRPSRTNFFHFHAVFGKNLLE